MTLARSIPLRAAAALIAVLAALAVALPLATSPDFPPDAVLLIDGRPLTALDLELGEASVRDSLPQMRQALERDDFGPAGAAQVQGRLHLAESVPPRTVALASAIHRYALYARALDLGVAPDEAQVRDQVARSRQFLDDPQYRDETQVVRDAIDRVGEDAYWDRVLPSGIRLSSAAANLKDHFERHIDPLAHTGWFTYERQVVRSARLVILDPAALTPADLTAARRYLDRYFALTHPEPSPATPAP